MEQSEQLLLIHFQKAGERHSVPDRERLRSGHACRRGPLSASEERAESADDWRVPGEPTETVQQGCPGVSVCFHFHSKC